MTMTIEEALDLDRIVRHALDVREETIRERCTALLKQGGGATNTQERMARIILDESLAPWDAMRAAADVARPRTT